MFYEKLLYKLFIYLAITGSIYLILKYTPYVKLETNKSLIISFILVILFVILEFIYKKLFKFDCGSCNVDQCSIGGHEQFTQGGGNTAIGNYGSVSPTGIASNTTVPKPVVNTTPPNVNNTGTNKQEPIKSNIVDNKKQLCNPQLCTINPESKQAGTNNMNSYVDAGKVKREQTYMNNRDKTMAEREYSTSGFDTTYQDPGALSQNRAPMDIDKRIEGDLDDELPYSDYNHLPVAAGYKSHDYEYGYNFIPPEKWYPQPPRPPVCVSDNRCQVCPNYMQGSYQSGADLKEWNAARRVTPPDNLNIDYVKDKLNSGR